MKAPSEDQSLGHRDLSIAYTPINSLRPYARNARTHTKHQIKMIADSIRAFGFTNPVLTDGNDTIVAGHGRIEAAKLLGMTTVPTVRLENLNEDQIRAYVIADNRLAEKAGWNNSILAIELQHLVEVDLGFEISAIGFEVPEIDLLVHSIDNSPEPKGEIADNFAGPPVSRSGDLWLLGKHRLLCGSALEDESVKRLMKGRKADAGFVDQPYNVPIDGHVSGNGAIQHREFAMASGEMSKAEFTEFLTTSLELLVRYSKPGSVHFACMDWRHAEEMLIAGRVFGTLLNLCVWTKDNGGMGSFYRSQHELIFVFRNGSARHRNNIQLGTFGRNRTNVWQYPGVNTLSRQGEEGNLLALHPTVKPVPLVADALLDYTAPGGLVIDTFLGSGSTLIAAERTGRVCYGMELDPLYVDTAIRRWQRYTGGTAVHAESGKTFVDEEAGRA